MNCEDYIERISAALDGELSPQEQAELDAHLAVCPECRRLRDELAALDRSLADCVAQVPEGFSRRVMDAVAAEAGAAPKKCARVKWKPMAAAAAVLVVVLLGTGRWISTSRSGGDAMAGGADETQPMAISESGESISNGNSDGELNGALRVSDGIPENSLDSSGAQPASGFYSNERYLKVTPEDAAETEPDARIIGSADTLNALLARYPDDDLSQISQAYGPDFFQDRQLLAVTVEEEAGAAYRIVDQGGEEDQVVLERKESEEKTGEKTQWLILAEVPAEYTDGQEIEVVLAQAVE